MEEIVLPSECNYVAVFLTFSCQLRCVYCINHHGGDLVKGRRLDGDQWIEALNRIKTRSDLPLTIQGGEPTTHRDFYKILNGVRSDTPIDILTNLEVDIERFTAGVRPERLKRDAKYANIRVSYHHGQSDFKELTTRVRALQDRGYSIGIWEVDNPEYHGEVIFRQQVAHSMGIDYRLKEFLGPSGGTVHGTMRYADAVNSHFLRHCNCRTSELLIDPAGNVFRCHSDLYANRGRVGSLLDSDFTADHLRKWLPCAIMGKCNSCDIKLKTNRFQEYGHSSVDIKDISAPYAKNGDYISEVVNTYGQQDKKPA